MVKTATIKRVSKWHQQINIQHVKNGQEPKAFEQNVSDMAVESTTWISDGASFGNTLVAALRFEILEVVADQQRNFEHG
eukprot:3168428-Amphidinium_carterae.1